ncbi:MAG: esterase-like activity of phytase family protein [Pseudomonadales bacterium]|nr:esterase-like activity of phytase family protein [Pseudomonadales bacterium]
MYIQGFSKKNKKAVVIAALLLGAISGTAASPFDSDGQILSIDAIDVIDNNSHVVTYSASLELVSSEPLSFILSEAKITRRPGGNRALFDTVANTITIPGVDIDGKGSYDIEMESIPGSSPLQFNVTRIEKSTGIKVFNRISTFPVYLNSDIENETVAEIVDASKDGNTLVYTDSVSGKIGFVDITQPGDPKALGTIDLGGEPTSVAVAGDYALVAVNTSPSFIVPSGTLYAVDIAQQTVVASFELGGQPDSVAVSPDGQFAAVIIENERDEDLGDGEPSQAPSGFLTIVDLDGAPAQWSLREVSLDGIADVFPNDAEPEYVDINQNNVAVLTLQENNHIVLIDLPSGSVIQNFSAGTVDLTQIDTKEEDPASIKLNDTLLQIPREPDGVAWLNDEVFAIANEGDLQGGSRGFSVFDSSGNLLYDAGNSLEHESVRVGHYPDDRSGNKGNEPENIDYGLFDGDEYMFVASERASLLFVYNLTQNRMQTLPAGVAPEGVKAIPGRNLVVVASEADARADLIRSSLSIYQLQSGGQRYPVVESVDRFDGTPIPWGALSGLAADREIPNTVYAVPDSFYQKSRIFTLGISDTPAIIFKETVLKDSGGLLADVAGNQVNSDGTVNLDLEGIASAADGGFWLVSEGAGTVGDASRPVTSNNLLIHALRSGIIDQVVSLSEATNGRQLRFGFEGVAAVGPENEEKLFVAFQREWNDDPDKRVRIGRYDTVTGEWRYFYYPLDDAASPNGGWVGLSEITAINEQEFAVVERDNQGNADARIKRVYRFSIDGLTPLVDPANGVVPTFPLLEKTLVRDLMPDLQALGGVVLEKIEGMTVTSEGNVLIVNDNDGVSDSNGETQLLRFQGLFQ